MAKCIKCNTSISMFDSLCDECAEQQDEDALINDKAESEARSVEKLAHNLDYPSLSILLFLLAGISLLGSIVVCVQLWPIGRYIGIAAYTPGLMALSAGVVQFALYSAIGLGLMYLKKIAYYSEVRTNKKSTVVENII